MDSSPIIIYQMGKVGSSSIKASLEKLNLPNRIFHAHFLAWKGIEDVEKYYHSLSMGNMPGHIVSSRQLRQFIDQTLGQFRWKIITLVRDPVARDISDVFQNLDRDFPDLLHAPENMFMSRISEHVHDLLNSFNESTDYACRWFDNELKDVFQFDIYAHAFDMSKGFSLYSAPHADILVLKLEKLSGCASEAFENFLDIPDFALSSENIAEKKWYHSLYKRFTQALILPQNILDKIYRSRYSRHFYADQEIADFKIKWSTAEEPKETNGSPVQRVDSQPHVKRILFIHPEGNINNNPNFTGIVEILCEQGYRVEILSLRRSDINQISPCINASLHLIDVPNFGYALYYPFIVPTDIATLPESHRSSLKQSFSDVALIIGVDRGIIDASRIAAILQRPFGLISYEISFAEETNAAFKKLEIEACKGLAFAVCQGQIRSLQLSKENEIPLGLVLNIPVAGRGVHAKLPHTHFFHDYFGLNRNMKIALYMGTVTAPWAMIREVIESTNAWSDEWVLLLHHRYGKGYVRQIYQQFPHLESSQNVFLSPLPELGFSEIHRILNEVDLGFGFYTTLPGDITAMNNLKYIGLASGKIATYLQYGVPVMTNEIGEMSKIVRDHKLGCVVPNSREIANTLNALDHKTLFQYSHNAITFFEKSLDLNLTIQPLLDLVHELVQKDSYVLEQSSFNNKTIATENAFSGEIPDQLTRARIINEGERISKLFKSGRLEETKAELEKVLVKYPDSPDLLNLHAVLKLHMKDREGAKGILLDLVKNQPPYYPTYVNLACFFWNDGDTENAVKYFEEALRMSNYDRSAVLAYGEMLMSYKKYTQAKDVFERYLKINPNDSDVKSLLQKCEGVLGKVNKLNQAVGKIKSQFQ